MGMGIREERRGEESESWLWIYWVMGRVGGIGIEVVQLSCMLFNGLLCWWTLLGCWRE